MQSNEPNRASKPAPRFILPAITIILAAPIASHASAIPGPIVALYAMSYTPAPAGALSWFQSGSNIYGDAIASASATFTGTTTSSVTASGSSYQTALGALTSGSPPESYGEADLTFYLQALPIIPVPTLSAPIIVVSDVSTTMTASNGIAGAEVFVYSPDLSSYAASEYCAPTPNCADPASGGISDLQLTLNAGELYEVSLTVLGSMVTPGTWSATIDPEIYIDPSFQYASDFILETSAPLTSSSAPEPSSSLLFGAGLLLVGAGLRKRHTKSVAQADHRSEDDWRLRSH